MRTFKKLVLALAASSAAVGLSGAANAAASISYAGGSGTFGNSGIAAGSFTDLLNFTLPVSGTGNFTITTSSTGVDFKNVTIDGHAFSLTSVGPFDYGFLIGQALTAGVKTLSIGGTSTGNGSYGGSITFSAAAVPEPATWAMMIGGLGLVGGAMRRRAKHQQLAVA